MPTEMLLRTHTSPEHFTSEASFTHTHTHTHVKEEKLLKHTSTDACIMKIGEQRSDFEDIT